MRYALLVSTAYVTTLPSFSNREARIIQYLQGLAQIKELISLHPEFDVFAVDNTVEHADLLDERLIRAMHDISNFKGSDFFWDNELGKKNKGAGLAIQWKHVFRTLPSEYAYVVHFEPRQKLINFSFFEKFLAQPGNYFRIMKAWVMRGGILPWHVTNIATGMVAAEARVLRDYAEQVSPQKLVTEELSIERDLYTFIRSRNIPYTNVPFLELWWDNIATGEQVHL